MSKRSIRRHHARRLKLRVQRDIYYDVTRWAWFLGNYTPSPHQLERIEKWWHSGSRPANYSATPGWWNREFHTRPARIRSNQSERLVEKGVDWDLLRWPNYRKPHIYYW